MSEAERLRHMADIVEKSWSPEGIRASASAAGTPSGPCLEEAAAMVGYPIARLRAAGLGWRANARLGSGAAAGRALRGLAAEREEVVTQVPTERKTRARKPRQRTGAASASRSSVAPVMLIALLVGAALVVHVAATVASVAAAVLALALAALKVAAIVLASAGTLAGAVTAARVTRVRHVTRRKKRAAVEAAREAILAPIALPYRAPISTHDVLLTDWTGQAEALPAERAR